MQTVRSQLFEGITNEECARMFQCFGAREAGYEAGALISEFDGHKIKKGEIMALENGKIVNIGVDVAKTTYRLARSMVKKDTSFITLISGCDVSEEEAQRTTELVQAKVGDSIEVTLINGGQPVYYYMISVE